jgi:hypothetical protein
MEVGPNIVVQYYLPPKSGLDRNGNPFVFEMNLNGFNIAVMGLFHIV